MQTPIFNRLKEIKDQNLVSFHMPGHKYGRLFEELGYEEKLRDFYSLDTTEIIGTDNLHEPKGIILESENYAKEVIFKNIVSTSLDKNSKLDEKKVSHIEFDEIELFYLVNGTTCGIQAAITATAKSGDSIIINRSCHHSAYNTCMINNIEPIFVGEKIDESSGIFLGVDSDEYMRAMDENPDASVVFITRPSYYGMVFDIKKIIEKAHSRGMMVVVDEAHGAHFGLSEQLPTSAICYGADVVIQSIHKTLPAFTQTSILLCQGGQVDRSKLKHSRSEEHTSELQSRQYLVC